MITRDTWRPARVVFRKELTDGLRDRRTLLMALFFPLLGPLTLAVALHYASQTMQKVAREGITLPVAGAGARPQPRRLPRRGGADRGGARRSGGGGAGR